MRLPSYLRNVIAIISLILLRSSEDGNDYIAGKLDFSAKRQGETLSRAKIMIDT